MRPAGNPNRGCAVEPSVNSWYWILLLVALSCRPPCQVERCATESCCGPSLCACEPATPAGEPTLPLDFTALLPSPTPLPADRCQASLQPDLLTVANDLVGLPRHTLIRGPPSSNAVPVHC